MIVHTAHWHSFKYSCINILFYRLWRDVWQGVSSTFYHLFRFMEDEGILDVTDELHLFCLHLIYIPRINQHLSLWRESWNSHPLSSCANKSPTQLWIEGQPRLPAILPDPDEVYTGVLAIVLCTKPYFSKPAFTY